MFAELCRETSVKFAKFLALRHGLQNNLIAPLHTLFLLLALLGKNPEIKSFCLLSCTLHNTVTSFCLFLFFLFVFLAYKPCIIYKDEKLVKNLFETLK